MAVRNNLGFAFRIGSRTATLIVGYPVWPEILDELWKLLEGMRGGYGQERTYRRAIAMVLGELFNLGRHTVTQMLRSLGVVGEDWSAWYRMFGGGRFDEEAVGGELVRETVKHVERQSHMW